MPFRVYNSDVAKIGSDTLYALQGRIDYISNKPPPFGGKIGPMSMWKTRSVSGYLLNNAGKPKRFALNSTPVSYWDPTLAISTTPYLKAKATFELQEMLGNTDFNAGVAGAELNRSVSLILNSSTRIYAALKALKKGRLGDMYNALGISEKSKRRVYPKPKKVRDNMSSYWLEAQYGWNPLYNDCYNGARSIAMILNDPVLPLYTATGRASQRTNYPVIPAVNFYAGHTEYRIHSMRQTVLLSTYYRIRNPDLFSVAKLGLTNPLIIAWEVVPFSFVIDWFLPLGNYLSQLSAYHGLEFMGGYQTLTERHYEDNTLVKLNSYWDDNVWDKKLTARNSIRVQRTKINSFPYAPLVAKDPISVLHVANSIALITQLFRK